MSTRPNASSRYSALTDPQSARGRLLRQAAHLFRDKGYERTTVRDLGAAVGIQSGSIFHHFQTKEAILRAVMVETILYNTARMEAALVKAQSDTDRIRALIHCELEAINGETGEAMAVLVYEWRSLTPESQAEILVLRDRYEALWIETLEGLAGAGLVKADPFVLRRLLTGALSWTVTWFKPEGKKQRRSLDLDDLTAQVMLTLGLPVH